MVEQTRQIARPPLVETDRLEQCISGSGSLQECYSTLSSVHVTFVIPSIFPQNPSRLLPADQCLSPMALAIAFIFPCGTLGPPLRCYPCDGSEILAHRLSKPLTVQI